MVFLLKYDSDRVSFDLERENKGKQNLCYTRRVAVKLTCYTYSSNRKVEMVRFECFLKLQGEIWYSCHFFSRAFIPCYLSLCSFLLTIVLSTLSHSVYFSLYFFTLISTFLLPIFVSISHRKIFSIVKLYVEEVSSTATCLVSYRFIFSVFLPSLG